MNDTTTTTTTTAPAKLSGFSTAKTQQNGALVTLARCDWQALLGSNSLPSNPAAIGAALQSFAPEGAKVVAWLQGPAVILDGHDSKGATAALLATVNGYQSAMFAAAAAAEADREAEAAAEAAAAAPVKRNGRGR